MEVIKKDTNTEFVVIYADGTRKRISLRPEALDFVQQMAAPVLSALAGGGIRSMVESIPNVVAISRADHDILHWGSQGRHEAAFRLGQMDMQASITDMLTDLADGTHGDVCTTLIDVANRIRRMPLAEKVEGDADGST